MKKQKLISILTILVMLFTLIPVGRSIAATPTISVEEVETTETTATVAVKLSESISINNLTFDVKYDVNKMEVTEVTKGDIIPSSMYNTITTAEESNRDSAVRTVMMDLSLGNVTIEAGTFFTITFNIKDGVSGKQDVKVSFDDPACGANRIADNGLDTVNVTDEITTSDGYVNLIVAVEGIALDSTSLNLNAGDSTTLSATLSPSTTTQKTVTWSSSNTSVATVSNTGVVTAKGIGTATITATAENGKTASATITVKCAHKNTTTHEAVASTCTVQGNAEYVTCDDCGEVISGSAAKLDLAEHNYEYVAEVSAIHTADELSDGVKAHYKCTVCGKVFDENYNETTEEELVIATPTHTYEGYESDATYHWQECGCGNIIAKAEHTASEAVSENEVKATCEQNGSYEEVVYCETCGYEMSRTEKTITATGHKEAEPVRENEVKATCEKDGSYEEVVYCTDCNKEISRTEKTITATGHTEAEPVRENEVKATCEKDGSYEEVVYCTECDKEISRTEKTITATGHTETEPVKENIVEATTEKDGSYEEVVYCLDCGKELSRTTVVVPIKEEIQPEESQEQDEANTNNDTTEKVETTPAEENSSESANSSTPKTGDESNMTLWISGMIVFGILFVMVLRWQVKGQNQKRKAKHSL